MANAEASNGIDEVEVHRSRFRRLLATNPNYFGTAPEIGFEAVFPKLADSSYEGLTCVAYSPERDRLEATIDIRRSSGYSGGLCDRGSFEHVRFYVSYDEGGTWEDAGMASTKVHDLPPAEDCQGFPVHPVSYVVGLDYRPRRSWCVRPVLPLIRAILSWEVMPPAAQPDWTPIWGEVHACHGRIRPRPFFLSDVADRLSKDVLHDIPAYVLQQVPHPHPDPDPGPLAELPLSAMVKSYRAADVPDHRFAMPHLLAAADAPRLTGESLLAPATTAKELGVDLGKLSDIWGDPQGDTSFEELECAGLDNNTDQLVATFRIKRPSGYSGGPCYRGSVEYVAFWADFGRDCTLTYLGTAEVRVHDFTKLPRGGICYAAVLPVDLGAFRRDCGTPVFGRVRAVLSWATPPSTTDPNELPVWGNRVDTHVQLRPGRPYTGTARFSEVGGVDADQIDVATGLTSPGAALAVNGSPLPADCPFAGLVTLHGPLDPALAGQSYRVLVRNVTSGGPLTELTSPFLVNPVSGPSVWVTPGAGGWSPWPTWWANTDGVLGYFNPGGEDQWEIRLELAGSGVVDVRTVQADNLVRDDIVPGDSANAGDLQLFTGGACRLPRGPLSGRFVARDRHFHSWGISVHGGPGGPVNWSMQSVGIGTGTETSLAGEPFTLDLSRLEACGYTVQLTITDRAVVNSAWFGHYTTIERGLCLE